MSSNNSRRGRHSGGHSYRLNRAALMRMEEGRRKMYSNDEEYNGENLLCIQLEPSRSNLIDQTEELPLSSFAYEDESYSVETEEESIANKRKAKCRKSRNKERNSSIISSKTKQIHRDRSKPELYRRRRTVKSAGSGKSAECRLEARREHPGKLAVSSEVTPRRRTRVSKTSKSSQATSIPSRSHHRNAEGVVYQPGTKNTRRNVEFTKQCTRPPSPDSPNKSSGRQFPSSQSARISRPTNISWAPSPGPSTSYSNEIQTISNQNQSQEYGKSREGGKGKSQLLPRSRNHSLTDEVVTTTGETTSPRVQSLSFSDQSHHLTSILNVKKTSKKFSTQETQQKNNTVYENLKSSTTNDLLASSIGTKPKHITTATRRTITKKVGSAAYPGINYKKRLVFEPVISSVIMNPDQKEVISKWRKRLGTISPNSAASQNFSSSVLASSLLRDSQILRVHNEGTSKKTSRKGFNASNSTTIKLSESDFPEVDLDEMERQNMLAHRRRRERHRHPSDVLSPSEEEALFQTLEKDRKMKRIRSLEEVAQTKLEQLETIKWKKRRALEEELLLNERLEKILFKIQELRGSESFARLIDKQTQVFATKRPKISPNI